MREIYKQTVHFGSGELGREVVEFAESRAKALNLMNAKGEPNISGYVVYLINKDRGAAKKIKTSPN